MASVMLIAGKYRYYIYKKQIFHQILLLFMLFSIFCLLALFIL